MAQPVLFPNLAYRPVVATFDQPHASSDGGTILLKAADRRLGLRAALTAIVPDARASGRVTHGGGDLVSQRVFESVPPSGRPAMIRTGSLTRAAYAQQMTAETITAKVAAGF